QISIIIAIIVSFFGLYLYRPKIAVFAFIFTLPLMHKELFSLYQWDLLPVRFATAGMLIAVIFDIFKTIKLEGFPKTKEFISKSLLTDRLIWLLSTILFIKLFASVAANTPVITNQFILFFIESVSIYVILKYTYSKLKMDQFPLHLVIIYLIMALFVMIFAVVQMYLINAYGIKIGSIWPVPNNLPRLGSSFWDVNHFGGFLVTVIPIFFMLVFGLNRASYKVLAFLGLGFSSLLLFLTQSRSSWLGITVAMLIGLTFLISRRYYKPVLLFLVGLTLMSGVFFAYLDIKDLSIRQKVANYMHYRLDSTDTHVMLLEGAIQIYLKDPVLGTGPGNFDSSFRQTETSEKYFEREPNLKNTEIPTHSVWGEVIAETGYLGFATYILMAMFLILASLYTFHKSEDKLRSYLGLGFFISLIGIYVTGIFYSYNLEFYWFVAFLSFLSAISSFTYKLTLLEVFKWASNVKFLYIAPLLIISGFFIFINLGGATLLEWDEAIYAKVAKNIIITGDWLNLHWTRLDKYWFEKPPLYMWLTAITFKITGPDEFGARLWAAIFGVGSVIITYLLGKNLFNKFTGFVAALILISTAHFLYYSRNSILDVPVTFFILSAVLTYIYAKTANKHSIIFFIVSGISIGLAVMTKSIVGLIPFALIGLNEISQFLIDKKRPPFRGLISIFISSLVLFLPWHVYEYLLHGSDFLKTYFLEHVFDRSTEGLGHVKPIWWYSDVILSSFRIWVGPLIVGIPYYIHNFKKDKNLRFVFLSVLFIYVFFSIPKDKLLWYIVPLYPFLAILTARFIEISVNFIFKNLNLKNFSVSTSRILFIVIFILFVPFYITTIWDKVSYEDENKDIVALIKIHNQLYPVAQYPEMYMRYATAPYTVVLFYSDHEPKATSKEELLDLVDDARPDQFYTFLITENRFYEMRGKLKEEVSIPADLRIKASSGRYVIARSYSQVELLQEEIVAIEPQIKKLIESEYKNEISDFEKSKLIDLKSRYKQIVNSLQEFGYPYETPLQFN
ncbi:MAG: glycosyltransferase family 39 protein, partial [Candidatus Woesearchaeota archaeon]